VFQPSSCTQLQRSLHPWLVNSNLDLEQGRIQLIEIKVIVADSVAFRVVARKTVVIDPNFEAAAVAVPEVFEVVPSFVVAVSGGSVVIPSFVATEVVAVWASEAVVVSCPIIITTGSTLTSG